MNWELIRLKLGVGQEKNIMDGVGYMSKIALITDTHAGARNDNQVFNEYFLTFFEKNFFPYLLENKIDTIVHLGDIWDRRKYVNFNTLNSWRRRVFDFISKNNINMYIILGNHDCYHKNNNNINSVNELLAKYSNIKIFGKAKEVEFDDLKFLFVPWVNQENESETLDAIRNTTAEILLGHIEIKGFQMHRGSLNIDKGFSVEDLKKFEYVMSGHFHHKSSNNGIHYLGSPYEMSWHDWNDKRGFHVFDTETRKLSFIENELKIFHKIVYDDKGKTLEEILSKDFSLYSNMYVKVIVSEKTNAYFFDTFMDNLNAVNPSDVKIIEKVDDLEEIEIDENSAKDTLSILKDHIDNLNIEIDKKKLCDLMSDLYIEALNVDIE